MKKQGSYFLQTLRAKKQGFDLFANFRKLQKKSKQGKKQGYYFFSKL